MSVPYDEIVLAAHRDRTSWLSLLTGDVFMHYIHAYMVHHRLHKIERYLSKHTDYDAVDDDEVDLSKLVKVCWDRLQDVVFYVRHCKAIDNGGDCFHDLYICYHNRQHKQLYLDLFDILVERGAKMTASRAESILFYALEQNDGLFCELVKRIFPCYDGPFIMNSTAMPLYVKLFLAHMKCWNVNGCRTLLDGGYMLPDYLAYIQRYSGLEKYFIPMVQSHTGSKTFLKWACGHEQMKAYLQLINQPNFWTQLLNTMTAIDHIAVKRLYMCGILQVPPSLEAQVYQKIFANTGDVVALDAWWPYRRSD